MGRETGLLQLLAPLLLTGGKGADLVIRGNVVLNSDQPAAEAGERAERCLVEMAMGTRNPKPDGFLPH